MNEHHHRLAGGWCPDCGATYHYPGWSEPGKPMDIPKDKTYPPDAVQCDECGGLGCPTCGDKGWLPAGHKNGRKCERPGCEKPIPPGQVAVYCSNECAYEDA